MSEEPRTAGDRPNYAIGSVDSALRLLMMVGERHRIRIAEAASELGVARSTAHRLMQMLLYFGFVQQEPESKAYVAGPRLLGLGLQIVRKLAMRDIAHPYLLALAAEVGETVHLWMLQPEGGVLCIESIESAQTLRVGSRAGMLASAATSAAGRAILATMSDEKLLELYPSARLARSGPSPLTRRSDLFDIIRRTREAGFTVQRNEIEFGVSAVAAPLMVRQSPSSYSLSIALPTSRMSHEIERSLGQAVKRCAAEISVRLGY